MNLTAFHLLPAYDIPPKKFQQFHLPYLPLSLALIDLVHQLAHLNVGVCQCLFTGFGGTIILAHLTLDNLFS